MINTYIHTLLQLYKKRDSVYSSDNDMYASDADNLPKGVARQSSMSMSVGARSTEGDVADGEGFDEVEGGHVETESEDEDPEATRRYWEAKRKKEGVHKVRNHIRDADLLC